MIGPQIPPQAAFDSLDKLLTVIADPKTHKKNLAELIAAKAEIESKINELDSKTKEVEESFKKLEDAKNSLAVNQQKLFADQAFVSKEKEGLGAVRAKAIDDINQQYAVLSDKKALELLNLENKKKDFEKVLADHEKKKEELKIYADSLAKKEDVLNKKISDVGVKERALAIAESELERNKDLLNKREIALNDLTNLIKSKI